MTIVWGLYANHVGEYGQLIGVFSRAELAKTCKSIALDLRSDWLEQNGYWKCDAFSQLEGDEVFYYTVEPISVDKLVE